jgi:hypothetical protein
VDSDLFASTLGLYGKNHFISCDFDQVALVFVSEATISGPKLNKVTFLKLDRIRIIYAGLLIVIRCSHDMLHGSLAV